jgi:hypothetical protein
VADPAWLKYLPYGDCSQIHKVTHAKRIRDVMTGRK